MSDELQLSFADRYAAIQDQIRAAADRFGRNAEDITLVGACKRQPDAVVAESLAAGLKVYGENRVQEAQTRWETFADKRKDIELHLIGPLQSNKAEAAVELFDVIQTLDRPKLTRALADAGQKLGKHPECWVQVNTGEEPQKSGVLPGDLAQFIKTVRDEYEISVRGLMCIPPLAEPPGPHFAFLAKCAADHGLGALSMGMSADFETAIQFGATHIRVGTALFGTRPT